MANTSCAFCVQSLRVPFLLWTENLLRPCVIARGLPQLSAKGWSYQARRSLPTRCGPSQWRAVILTWTRRVCHPGLWPWRGWCTSLEIQLLQVLLGEGSAFLVGGLCFWREDKGKCSWSDRAMKKGLMGVTRDNECVRACFCKVVLQANSPITDKCLQTVVYGDRGTDNKSGQTLDDSRIPYQISMKRLVIVFP